MDPDINVKMIEEVANPFKQVEDGIAIGTDSDSGLKYRDLEREWSNKGRKIHTVTARRHLRRPELSIILVDWT